MCGRKGYLAWQDPDRPETEEPITVITVKSDVDDTNGEKIDAIKKELENAGCSAASLIAEHLDALLSFNDDNEEVLIAAVDLEEVADWAKSTAQKLRALVK